MKKLTSLVALGTVLIAGGAMCAYYHIQRPRSVRELHDLIKSSDIVFIADTRRHTAAIPLDHQVAELAASILESDSLFSPRLQLPYASASGISVYCISSTSNSVFRIDETMLEWNDGIARMADNDAYTFCRKLLDNDASSRGNR